MFKMMQCTPIRKLTERVFRGTKLRRSLKLANRKLDIWITPDSQLKYLFGRLDDDLIGIAEKYVSKGCQVFDIGANCGVFGFASYLMGAKQIFSFEPDLFLASLIEKSVSDNCLSTNFSVVPIALSDDVDTQVFEIASRGRASNSFKNLGRQQKCGVRSSKSVVTNALDSYQKLGTKNCFIKIDVEGAELMVIRGGLQFIQAHSPSIFVEVSDATCSEIHDLLGSMGYKSEEIYPNNYIFMNETD